MKECSFNPSISQNSVALSTSMYHSRSKSPNQIHDRLYFEGLKATQKREKLFDEEMKKQSKNFKKP
jgi:hypothetical protein